METFTWVTIWSHFTGHRPYLVEHAQGVGIPVRRAVGVARAPVHDAEVLQATARAAIVMVAERGISSMKTQPDRGSVTAQAKSMLKLSFHWLCNEAWCQTLA